MPGHTEHHASRALAVHTAHSFFFFFPHEGLQTSTRLITPARSARIVEHRDGLGAHEVPST
eukprot:5481318-Prymnesium_polylepis.1